MSELAGPAAGADSELRPADVRHRVRGDRADIQRQRGGAAEGDYNTFDIILHLSLPKFRVLE